MAAPKGNQFWKLRSKHGRDKLFSSPELLWNAACEYFEWCEKNPWKRVDYKGKDVLRVEIPTERPFTITGLCLYLGCNSAYFRQFKEGLSVSDEDFSTIVTRIEEIIYTQKFEGAAIGAFNPNIIARDLGLVDRTDNNHKNDGGKFETATQVNQMSTDELLKRAEALKVIEKENDNDN